MSLKKVFYNKLWHTLLTSLIFLLLASESFGQDSTRVNRAVYWIKQGQYAKAKEICREIILKYPQQVAAEILLGRLYSWDQHFDSARHLLNEVLKLQPDNEEALNAIINVELWSNELEQALKYCNKAILLYPNSESLHLKKAKIYNKQANYKKASNMVEKVIALNPNNKEAIRLEAYLKGTLVNQPEKNRVGLSYYYDSFNNTYTPWSFASIYIFHKGKAGSISGSLNYADRFNTRGMQYELNLYPKISSSMRAYIGAAYSNESVFSTYSARAGFSQRMFKRTELEAGARYMKFKGHPILSLFIQERSIYQLAGFGGQSVLF